MNLDTLNATTQTQAILDVIDEINLFIGGERDKKHLLWDYWLGNSNDGFMWAMFAVPSRDDVEHDEDVVSAKYLIAWLTDPPQRSPETIGEILYAVHVALLAGGKVSEELLQSIIDRNEFPHYKLLSEHIPNPPAEWANLPVEIGVRLDLSAGAWINRASFEEAAVDTIQEAVINVTTPRVAGPRLIYEILAVGTVPIAPYVVDWPLAKRGKQPPLKRGKMQGPLPWDEEASACLFSIYQGPKPRLAVAGRSPERAIENWYVVAKDMRTLIGKK